MSAMPPSQGAPVSGPGALSQRTDLSPGGGGSGQPVRVATGQPQGSRQAAEQQQQAAPMQAAPPGLVEGAFGPTRQPEMGPQSQANRPVEQPPQDPDAFLRAIYRAYPHPDIERLLMQRARMV